MICVRTRTWFMTLETFKPLLEAVLLGASAYCLALFFAQTAVVVGLAAGGKVSKASVSTVPLGIAFFFFVLWGALQ